MGKINIDSKFYPPVNVRINKNGAIVWDAPPTMNRIWVRYSK